MSTEPETTEGAKEPSPYIRTYAKDFASLSQKNPELATDSKPKHGNKIVQPKIIPKQQDEKPKPTLSNLDAEAQNIEERTREELLSMPTNNHSDKEASIALPEISPGDIVKREEPIAPVMATPAEASIPIPEPIPVTTTQAPAAGPSDEERAAILSRLKAKASASASAEANQQEPMPTIPVMVPAPVIPAYPVSNIEKSPEPIALPRELEVQHREETPSPIHTYKSDFSDHVEEKNASAFSIIAAEKDARRAVPAPVKRGGGKLLPIVIGVILLVVGSGGVYAAYLYMNKNAPILLSPTRSTLIAPDTQVQLTGTGFTLMKALADKANEPLANDSVLSTFINISTTTAQGVTESQTSGGAFITELNLAAPDILLRNIDPSSMVGIVHAGTQTSAFFILRVTSYERTFAGMLQWESSMLKSLRPLYSLYSATITQTTATAVPSSSSTTPAKIFIPSVDPTAPASQFVDEIVASHSARALKDNSGRTLVLYGYADKQTLIIARDEAAFSLLLARLAATGN